MFEHVPFYHGETFTHLEFLIFIVSFWIFAIAFVLYMISLLVLKCFGIKKKDFEKYSPHVLEFQREEKLINMAISTGFLRKKTDYVRRTNQNSVLVNIADKSSIRSIIQNFEFSDDEEDEGHSEVDRDRKASNLEERLSLLRKNTKQDESIHKEVEESIAQGFNLGFKTRSDYKEQMKNLLIVQKYKELMNYKDIVTDYVKPPLSFSLGTKISFSFRFLAAVFLAILPCIFSGFEIINSYVGSILAFLILFLAYRSSRSQRTSRRKKKNKVKGLLEYLGWLENCNEFKIEGYLSFCVILMLSLLLASVFTGSCLTVGSSPLGIPIPIGFKTASLTTGFIRVFKNESLNCYDKAGPCHFVATVGQQASTEALVTIHLPANYSISDITLFYDEEAFYKDPNHDYMRNIANKSNVTNVWKMQRYIITYHITNLKPDTRYKFITRMKQGYNQEYDKEDFQNITCLAYLRNGDYNSSLCKSEDNPGVPNTVPHLLYETLPADSTASELKFVSMSDIGTSNDVDNWVAYNKDLLDIDLILMNGNIAMDNGEINCYCLWDYVLQDLEALFARAGRIIPILPNIGDMDVGYKGKNFTGFVREMNHYSNEGFKFLPINLFLPSYSPSAWIEYKEKGMLKYNVSGVDLITFDGGYFTDLSDPYRKQEFQKMTIKSNYVMVMVYGSIFPACALNEYEYDTISLRQNWKAIFDLRADIVIEGSSFGLKREITLISMDPNSTETVYLGDSFISGEPVNNNTKCYNGDVDADEYNKKTIDKNIWFITIKNGKTTVTAKNLQKVLDTYTFDMNKNGV